MPPDSSAAIRRVVAEHLGVSPERRVVPLTHGGDHDSYLVDDRLVVRRRRGGAVEMGVEREARLLDLLAEVSPLPVPRPVFVAPDDGCLAYEWLDGVPLLDVHVRDADREAIAGGLGTLLRALHDVDADRLAGLVEVDDTSGVELLELTTTEYEAAAAAEVPARARPAIEAFLAATPPPPADALTFSHNDLGIEHVLVDPQSTQVTGVIDWSDAALTDPARDFGLIHRDLGPEALDAALAAFAMPPGEEEGFRRRVLFHARCALLEDLAFGVRNDRPTYVDKSLAGLSWLFSDR